MSAGAGRGDGGRHDVLCVVAGDPGELLQRGGDGRGVALGAPGLQGGALLGLHLGIDDQDAAVGVGGERGGLRGLEAVHAHHGELAVLDPPPAFAVGLDE